MHLHFPSKAIKNSVFVYGYVHLTGSLHCIRLTVCVCIADIASIFKQGLFNPLTMSGNILVNNVHVSVHSDWFLDSALDAVGLTHWLADVYQVNNTINHHKIPGQYVP